MTNEEFYTKVDPKQINLLQKKIYIEEVCNCSEINAE